MRPDGLVHADGPAILAGSDAPSLQVPDGFDIFSAQFSRDGDDLVIAANGNPPLTVIDYFTLDSPPALAMPNGAMLTGDVVELLAGPRAPGQYAQADAPEGAESIGRVETMTGSSTATRVSGETVELAQGDSVFQGDVIETAGDSTLGIRLEDGTLASMSSHSRLVLNEFVFEAGGSDNWMLVNLVEGAFAFLTGAIAPSGGMEITTPVAVMAIRGTMPVAFVAGEVGATQFFAASDKDYELLHLTTREILGIVSSAAGFSLSSPDAPLEAIELDPATMDEIDGLLDVLNDAAAELGLLGIQDESGFHTYTPFGSINGNLAALIEFLLLLDNALAEEAVLEVEDPDQFLMAEAELVAIPDQAATDEMSPVIIDVLDNDSHPDGDNLTVVFADVPNGQGSVTIVDGQYLVFDPGTDFDYLALGETTNVVITYIVADTTGAIATSTATVTLTGINQAPVIAPVGETNLDEQTDTQPINATIAVTFTDVDLNNVGHEAAVVGVAVNGETGGLTLNNAALIALVSPGTVIKNAGDGNGSVDFFFTAGSTVFDYLAKGEIVTLTYTVEIDDGDGGTAQQTFDVVITGTNDAPVINEPLSDVAATVVEDGFDANGNPVGNPNASGQIKASDVDNGVGSYSVAQPNGSFGVFAITATGAWTYTLDDAAADHLALGQTRTEVFEVTVTDGFGAIDKVLVTITVQGSNDAPGVSNVSLAATEDGSAVLAGFVGGDRDNDDNAASLTYDVTQPSEGSVINNGDGTFSFDPGDDFQDLGAGDTRQVTFTYTATDRHGLVSDPATVTVTVTGTNDVPVISGLSTGAVTEDAHPTTLTTVGSLTIVDPDAGESNFAPQANVAGTYGSFTLLANGTWSYSADNTQLAIQSLRAGDELTDSFTAVSSDGTATRVVTVTIHGTNDVATISGNASGNVVEDVTNQASGTLTVSDVDNGENVFLAVSPAALIGIYGSFTFDELTGEWSYTLDKGADHVQALGAGEEVTDTLLVTSLDGTDSQTITVTITGTADNATITGTATGTVTEDGASDGNPSTVQSVNGTLTVSDPDSGEDVFQAVSSADLTGTYGQFSFNELTGQWSYTLNNNAANVQALGAGQEVTDKLVVTSFDGSVSKNITVTVVGSNDKPVISVNQGDSDEVVLTADESTPTSFLMDMDSGDPIYTSGEMATVTFFISREEGQPPEQVTVEFLMGPSHVGSLANMIAAINAADNGLAALNTNNAFQFTLFVDGGAFDLDDISAVFTNPHVVGTNQFELGVLEVIEPGTDAEGVSATGRLSVGDVDSVDVVTASVVNELTIGGTGDYSLPGDLGTVAFLAMMSVGTNPVIASGLTTGSIEWTFDSGEEAFGFLDPNETLILTYTIAATDSAGAVTEHEVTITINGAGSAPQLLASSSDLEFSSAFMTSTESIDDDSGGEVFVLTETDLTINDLIIDYREGDVIDLTQLGFELATGQLNADAAGEYVAYDQTAGVLSVDMDGAGGEADFEAVAEFVTPPESIIVRLAAGDTTADIQIA